MFSANKKTKTNLTLEQMVSKRDSNTLETLFTYSSITKEYLLTLQQKHVMIQLNLCRVQPRCCPSVKYLEIRSLAPAVVMATGWCHRLTQDSEPFMLPLLL